jgi:hypothetical protein
VRGSAGPARRCTSSSGTPCSSTSVIVVTQLVVWGLTPHVIHSLVGCSSVIAI